MWRNYRWFVGKKKFGVVTHLIVGGGGAFLYFSTPITAIPCIFWNRFLDIQPLHYAVVGLNLQLSTCIVCLCRYHNLAVTQGASLINLEGPTPTKRHHGWHRAGKFCVSKLSEMAFSMSSLPLLLGPFVNSFIMICESMLSASQDGLLREMLLAKYRLQIFYFRNQLGFFWWGPKIIPPPYKTLGWGLVAPCGH